MSEYQYYEFQAVDRPLTRDQMAELRTLSSRATITPTQFVNFYNYGSFRGDPQTLMGRYFDAFVYVANWGTHRLMLRLPRSLLDPEVTLRYCAEEGAMAYEVGESVILEFVSEDEGGDPEDGSEWMAALLPLREELSSGDLRCLYLGWLLCAQNEILDEEEIEPPPPAGLGSLSDTLTALSNFLRIDDDLLTVAAEGSGPLAEALPSTQALAVWVQALPATEKDRLLLRLLHGDDPHLRAELLRRFRQARAPVPLARHNEEGAGRTVGQLIAAADRRAEARQREEAERQAQERARRQREHAAARAKHLDSLAGRELQIWSRIAELFAAKRPTEYDQVVRHLIDLRDLAARSGQATEFSAQLRTLREQHARKLSLLQRLDKAGLDA